MNLLDEQDQIVRLARLEKLQPHTGGTPVPLLFSRARKKFRVGECVVDCRTGVVRAPGQRQRLRPKELELLLYLSQQKTPVGREQLWRDVWNCSKMKSRTIDQTVVTLRRKLNDDSAQHLRTLYGIGYQLQKNLPTQKTKTHPHENHSHIAPNFVCDSARIGGLHRPA